MPKNKGSRRDLIVSGLHPTDVQLSLFPVAEAEPNGVQMGVLSDGTPYLTLRGLAKLCGVDHMTLQRMFDNWEKAKDFHRGAKIQELLDAQGFMGEELSLLVVSKGVETHAYVDTVCMAVLEYYAFETKLGDRTTALRNYRLLARCSFRMFIYEQCGFDPKKQLSEAWSNFRDRVLLNDQLPSGYYSVWAELSKLIIRIIKSECPFDNHTVPDISVGQQWSKYWAANGLEETYGERFKYPHTYPDYYPQSAATTSAWIYPVASLGDFRGWLEETYVQKHFPAYLERKVGNGDFSLPHAQQVFQAVAQGSLPAN